MAQEITARATLKFSKNDSLSIAPDTGNVMFDVAGNYSVRNIVSVGTGDETLDLGDVATNGWFFARNLDLTNYVDLGLDGSAYGIRLREGGGFCLLQWNGAAIHAKANTGACKIEYLLIEL